MHNLKEELMNFDWSLKSIVKVALGLIIIAFALSIVLQVLRPVTTVFTGNDNYYATSDGDGFIGGIVDTLTLDSSVSKEAAYGRGGGVANLAYSEDAIYAPAPSYQQEGGDEAEEYERRDYNVRYETRKFEETCTAIADLKPYEYVVFDYSNKSEDWCNYTFRVELEYEDDMIARLKALNPDEFSVDTATIERSVKYTDSELAMQERRYESLEETLTQAEESFNSLIAQAQRQGDTATLAEVINNKITTIDRLNQQLLNAQDQIDRLTRNQEGQIDQIEYAHFYVSAQKVTLIDTERFSDTWKQSFKELFNEVNATLLALTVGLVTFILGGIQLVVVLTISAIGLTFVARFVWVMMKRIWNWKR